MIITLCGSVTFEPWYDTWNEALSLAGHSVFSLEQSPKFNDGFKDLLRDSERKIIDDVHLNKIKGSDAIMVLNVFGYIGETTMEQIEFAKSLNKEIIFLESWGQGNGIDWKHKEEVISCAYKFGVYPNYVSPIDTWPFSDPWRTEILGPASSNRDNIVSRIKMHECKIKGY